MKANSWLPIFCGYYNSIFSPDFELEIDNLIEDSGIESLDFDDIEWDMESYKEEMGEACCRVIEAELAWEFPPDSKIKITYEKIVSPSFYNFETDHINCEYDFNDQFKTALRDYLIACKEDFSKYLKETYTSYPGFASFHSNDVDVWLSDYWGVLEEHGHYLGAILEFVLRNEEFDEYELRQAVTDVYVHGEISPEAHKEKQ